MEKCDQKDWNVLDQFDISIPCSATFFLGVGAHVSLKVTTKESFRGKNILKIKTFSLFFKAKTESATKKVEMFLINLASLYLVHRYISQK